MTPVELIYDHDCPNIEKTRTNLLKAFSEAGVRTKWVEWDRGDSSSPSHVRAYGSPTILVNGRDVAGIDPSKNIACCRLYPAADGGFNGAPSVVMIATMLRNIQNGPKAKRTAKGQNRWGSFLAVFPGIGALLIPIGLCPACWPAYAGLLSSLGFSFLFETAYLLPLTLLFLVIAVASLAYKATTRNGLRPFSLGLVASAMILVGKFILESDAAWYAGIAMLFSASLWNAWPTKKNIGDGKKSCPACASRGADAVIDIK